ncbi:hypothetical protein DAPPUDRAFT_125076 [Daphnia pulex]|uniref:Uncharacterized protein n=1 Tax=Daphnia pulex TaxID=6669 RepID=E9I726_DAPPU|nr:hypothetical protein DAPPUDRAFT_125076 [Daphnia pulex]|eukprot:EFX60204.1 hypothetical protein DAPPUDRAFT_125076 [Daphnia pulex]
MPRTNNTENGINKNKMSMARSQRFKALPVAPRARRKLLETTSKELPAMPRPAAQGGRSATAANLASGLAPPRASSMPALPAISTTRAGASPDNKVTPKPRPRKRCTAAKASDRKVSWNDRCSKVLPAGPKASCEDSTPPSALDNNSASEGMTDCDTQAGRPRRQT